MSNYKFGWLKEPVDERDFKFSATHAAHLSKFKLPKNLNVSVEKWMPPVWDQMNESSCVAHGSLAVYEFIHSHGGPFSRQEQYWNARLLEGTQLQDNGAYVRDGFKALATYGIGLEKDFPYVESTVCTAPPTKVEAEGSGDKLLTYSALVTPNDYKLCLVLGYPFATGINVYDSFMSSDVAATGVIPLPDINNEQLQGGHCVAIVGYNSNFQNNQAYYRLRNSWGTGWGDKGYGWIPASYLENASFGGQDSWTARKVA